MPSRIAVVCLGATLVVAGCETTKLDKSDYGTGIGAVVGGLLGATLGGSTGSKVALGLAGAAIGGLIGNQVGKYLDKQDRAAIETEAAKSLETAKDGQSTTWKNPDSGVEAEITPTDTRQVRKEVKIVRDKVVAPPPALDLIGETYVATSSTNIRPEPGTGKPPVGSLGAGQSIDVVGKVQGSNWYMVARNGKSVGYVSTSLLKPAPKTAQKPRLRTPEAYDLDKYKNDKDVVVEEVATTTECRKLQYTINVSSKDVEEKNDFEACKGPDGAWELDKVA